MNCPACAALLTPLELEGFVVDTCGACGGVWFDNFELARVDNAHERLGEALAVLPFNPAAVILRDKRPCPKCAGITMLQHKFSRDKAVLVDECPSCGGVWLDGGELAEIRRPQPGVEDRKKAAHRFLNRLFLEDLAQLKARRAEKRSRDSGQRPG
jgi:uncharacterized protein